VTSPEEKSLQAKCPVKMRFEIKKNMGERRGNVSIRGKRARSLLATRDSVRGKNKLYLSEKRGRKIYREKGKVCISEKSSS